MGVQARALVVVKEARARTLSTDRRSAEGHWPALNLLWKSLSSSQHQQRNLCLAALPLDADGHLTFVHVATHEHRFVDKGLQASLAPHPAMMRSSAYLVFLKASLAFAASRYALSLPNCAGTCHSLNLPSATSMWYSLGSCTTGRTLSSTFLPSTVSRTDDGSPYL